MLDLGFHVNMFMGMYRRSKTYLLFASSHLWGSFIVLFCAVHKISVVAFGLQILISSCIYLFSGKYEFNFQLS